MVEAGPYVEYCGQVYVRLGYVSWLLIALLVLDVLFWFCMTKFLQ